MYGHDKFIEEFRALVKGWRIADIRSPNSRGEGLCEFVLESSGGRKRCLTLCATDLGAWMEDVIDEGHIYVSIDDMLEKITRHIENNEDDEDELTALYGDNADLPLVKFGSIIALEDVMKLQLGFRFEKDGTEWWTTTYAVNRSQHPFRRLFRDQTGRRILADLLCRSILDPKRTKFARGDIDE